jgi:hypothetical protein
LPRGQGFIAGINSKNLLHPSLYSKKAQRGMKESNLIKNGKFHPIKKFSCDLNRLTSGNKEKFLIKPKNWFLRIEGQFRKNIEKLADLDGRELSNNFCISITIRDKDKKERIYNDVVQLLDNNSFIHQQIELREEVRVIQNQ